MLQRPAAFLPFRLGMALFIGLSACCFPLLATGQQIPLDFEEMDTDGASQSNDDLIHFPKAITSLGSTGARFRTFADESSLSLPVALDLHYQRLLARGEQILNVDYYFTLIESNQFETEDLEHAVYPMAVDFNFGKAFHFGLLQKVRNLVFSESGGDDPAAGAPEGSMRSIFLNESVRQVYFRLGGFYNQYTDTREQVLLEDRVVFLHAVRSYSVYAGTSWMVFGTPDENLSIYERSRHYWTWELYSDVFYTPVVDVFGVYKERGEDGEIFESGKLSEGIETFDNMRIGGRFGLAFLGASNMSGTALRYYFELALIPSVSAYYSQLSMGMSVSFPTFGSYSRRTR